MTRVVRGVRGATTAAANTAEEIFRATRELMLAVIEANDLHPEDVASVMLTMTPDLNADFPAKAVRSIDGWQWVPLMCATELAVPGSMPRCIRLLLHVNTDRSQEQMVHMYLGDAVALRPDMVEHAQTKNGRGGGA
ncbi:chorismate mutase [Alicyclobacillus macrosporangiidus]|jgi:chorismate mutase|uniref:chorismate mutase n=1 Tax=Alicyclobacillus macrosporangiidus TaxID=392015 RepID=A0A1I7KTF6_9BACL|nr:chorismate mutase [Alicyclobacillus macrosporangiidus]SFV00762.1 chorismate mutase [Alicyclobacillus macrosporangiidus]